MQLFQSLLEKLQTEGKPQSRAGYIWPGYGQAFVQWNESTGRVHFYLQNGAVLMDLGGWNANPDDIIATDWTDYVPA